MSFFSFSFPALSLLLFSSQYSRSGLATASEGCYYAYNNTIQAWPGSGSPCGTTTPGNSPSLNCCVVKSKNVCMSHNICYAPWTDGGLYYLSPCTDPTYSAEACPQYCSDPLVFLLASFSPDVFNTLPFLPHTHIPCTQAQETNSRTRKCHVDRNLHIYACC